MILFKSIPFIFLFTILSLSASAQAPLEIGVHGGYMLNGDIQFYEGTLDIDDNPTVGVSIGGNLSEQLDIELDYTWSTDTQIRFNSYGFEGFENAESKVSVHYIMLNGVHKIPVSDAFAPFFNVGMGAGIFDIKEHGAGTASRFTVNLGAGAKFYLSDFIGIKISARMIMPLYFSGVGFYTGIGTGGVSSGLSLNSTVAFIAGDFSGGIFLRLGQ